MPHDRPRQRLFALSFVALFLELMLIRWSPSVVRLVAYYANLLLVSSFLGLGLGALSCRHRGNLFRWFPLLLAGNIAVLLLCRQALLPGSGTEMRFYAGGVHFLNYLTLIGIFAANSLLFVPLGEQVGRLFGQLPTLQAYTWDLLGSLCGTVVFGLFSVLYFSPVLGMAGVLLIVLALSERRNWPWGVPVGLVCLAAMWWSHPPGAIWSPYYYITVKNFDHPASAPSTPPRHLRTMQDPPIYFVSVNQDFFQVHATIDSARYTLGDRLKRVKHQMIQDSRDQNLLPYQLAKGRRRVAVMGSGGGMDVEAALLSGARHVDAVEIDPTLIALARRDNASGCYDDPRVTVHVNDARAFLQNARPGYDLVVFGFLDSQALFTSMSNLRIDGYTYTVESLRTAYNLLEDGGVLSLSFAAGKEWLAQKLVRMVAEATGAPPLVYVHQYQIIVCAPKGKPPADAPRSFGRFARMHYDLSALERVEPATDDWPFLYLARKAIPGDYLIVIGVVLGLALASILALRRTAWGVDDGHFCFLGLGFLLLETKSIGDCSLYFGSTWLVTMLVVAGVLAMVLVANLAAARLRFSLLWYVPLFATLVTLQLVPREWVLALAFPQRLTWALAAAPLPIFFAGIIFSTTFRDSANPGHLFGANLVGAMIGGFSEYLGMATGTPALMLLIIGAYAASALCRLIMRVRSARMPELAAGNE